MTMQSFPFLLAKTSENPDAPLPDETLLGHTQNVCEAASILSDEIKASLSESLSLTENETLLWQKSLQIACWAHDFGKANDQFQLKIRKQIEKQSVRHETLSLFIFRNIETLFLSEWNDLPSWSKASVYFSIAGHHLKFPDPDSERPVGKTIALLEHPDFLSIIKYGNDVLKIALRGDFNFSNLLFNSETFASKETSLNKALINYRKEMQEDGLYSEKEKILIASVKAALMSADLAGSALPEKSISLKEWLLNRIGRRLTKNNLHQLVSKKLGSVSFEEKLHPFQKDITSSPKRTILLEAGCGSGKTAAAYLWASKWAEGKRLFFCYPTTTTASEGFAGYMRDPDFDPILIHSRATIDYRLLSNMPERSDEENDLYEARLEALETWPAEAAVCTAHAVLGLLENNRRSLHAWSSITRSAFVFDEIHSYSNRVFSYLLRFLESFPGSPVLLMTATLPGNRRNALLDVAKKRGGIETFYGPKAREESERYFVRHIKKEDTWTEAENVIKQNGKILWVSNTVDRAMNILDEAVQRNIPSIPFHSRFRYRDRLARQSDIIASFKDKNKPFLAATTQVAEISLDLSADLLISETAPVPSMIQRMGRLNRFEEKPKEPRIALFYDPETQKPYVLSKDDEEGKEIWNAAEKWLKKLYDGKPKSQADLALAFVEVSPKSLTNPSPADRCEWLDGLINSTKQNRSIEEASYSIDLIRYEDREEKHLDECVIPMLPPPKHLPHWRSWDRAGRFLIAPEGAIEYSEMRGGKWTKQ